MKKTIRIAKEDFGFPLDLVTQTIGILAVRGAGKSNTAAVMVEEMFKAKLPFVVIDPVGSWWGLKSSRDGKKPGLPIPVFGGQERYWNMPLERTAGSMIADLIVDDRLSCVIDTSAFSEGDKIRFLIDFAERLYRRNQDPLHLVLEEADDYAPQRPMRDQARLLRAWENVVRRGRSRGLGITMISQRSAALNKNVLTQIETLVAMRTTSPQDRKAIQGWVEYHGQSTKLLESLPGLEDGEAWIWSPHWLKTLKRVHIRYRNTFDSAATPKDIKGRRPPATLADINLKALEKKMSATIERAKDQSVDHWKRLTREKDRQIAELEKTTTTGKAVREAHEAACQAERKSHEIVAAVHRENTTLKGWLERYLTLVENVKKLLTKEAPHVEITALQPRKKALPKTTPTLPRPASPVSKPVPPPPRRREPISYPVADSNDHLQPRHLQILRSIARYEALGIHPVSKKQIGADAGHVASGGNFRTLMSQLHTPGYVEYVGQGYVALTDKGREAAGPVEELALPTHQNIMEMWRQRLQPRHLKVLEPIIERYPDPMTKAELGELVELAHESGNFRTLMSQIKTRGLVTYPGPGLVRAADVLFPGGVIGTVGS
ncbi:MAG: ATP-binding protein [Candidatus Methylomirabilales bacterium]